MRDQQDEPTLHYGDAVDPPQTATEDPHILSHGSPYLDHGAGATGSWSGIIIC